MTVRLSQTVPDNMAIARFKLDLQRPYLSKALWALQPVAAPDLGTLGVDKWWRLYYDPVVCEQWTPDEVMAVLYHELGHLLRSHHARAEAIQAQPQVWNVAGDCAVNSGLAAEKIVLPQITKGNQKGQAVFPSTFNLPDGLLTEEYYDKLLANATIVNVGVGAGDCGSCADGIQRPHEQGGPAPLDLKNPQPCGDAPGISDGEAALIRKQVAEDVKNFKSRGTVPSWMDRWADELLNPKIDWRRQLRAVVRRGFTDAQGYIDYAWSRPNRRQHAYAPFIMPIMRRPLPRVAFIVDTSGSMSSPELAQAIAEIDGVLKALNAAVVVLSVDAAVHVSKNVCTKGDVKLVGGGGTDMRVGIGAAHELKPLPHLIIVATDGETPWPAAPTRIPLIVALTSGSAIKQAPDWATVVEIIPETR